MDDLISRRAAIDALGERPTVWVESDYELGARNQYDADVLALETTPSAQPTLYGYKIEHLAYIARVMEKEGITAEQAAESFDDICTAIRLLIEETTQKVNEFVREMRRKEDGKDD